MNKKLWFIPTLIVAINVLTIAIRWSSLQEILPAHFDLEGNAAGEMPRNVLLMYPLIAAVFCLVAYFVARWKNKLATGLVILASGIGLIMLASTMVTLTSGTMPIFMLSEPIILLAALIAAIISIVKHRRIA